MTLDTNYPCPECQVGALNPRRAAYVTTLEGNYVCVPDFPAWVCDLCGRREYDAAALAELSAVLASDRHTRRHRPLPLSRERDYSVPRPNSHRRP